MYVCMVCEQENDWSGTVDMFMGTVICLHRYYPNLPRALPSFYKCSCMYVFMYVVFKRADVDTSLSTRSGLMKIMSSATG